MKSAASASMDEKKPRKLYLIRLLAFLMVVIFGFVVLETAASAIWKRKYNERLEERIHGYDQVDYDRSIIVPIPNSVITVDGHRSDLKKYNKPLGLKAFEESMGNGSYADSDVLFMINSYGFKGPEIDVPKPDSVFRILTIGDSCTFNPAKDVDSYPRTMERELNRLNESEVEIEVVNAGVPGYNIERVNKRIDEFLAAEPDLVTIYIGWNRTIGRADPRKSQLLYRKLGLYRIYYHFILNRTDTGLQEEFQTETYYDPSDQALDGFESYTFDYDMQDLEFMVDAIEKKDDAIRIVIITLAGIFDHRVTPGDRALDIAYPTAVTDNLYAWPLLTSIYNDEIRDFAGRHDNVDLIDFEVYALDHFIPRGEYFKDSVHPSTRGYQAMGEYFARELLQYVPD